MRTLALFTFLIPILQAILIISAIIALFYLIIALKTYIKKIAEEKYKNMTYENIRRAVFIDRPNRFISTIEIDGSVRSVT